MAIFLIAIPPMMFTHFSLFFENLSTTFRLNSTQVLRPAQKVINLQDKRRRAYNNIKTWRGDRAENNFFLVVVVVSLICELLKCF